MSLCRRVYGSFSQDLYAMHMLYISCFSDEFSVVVMAI